MQKVKNISSCSLKDIHILKRKLPPSSYEVIHLPTPAIKIPTKTKCYQEENGKRQKFTLSVASRAEEFRLKLDAKYPSFSKTLSKSHVSGSFWMGLPHPFCRKYLPQNDTYVILENEDGKQYRTKFLALKTAFSAGWRGFSESEKLSIGDVLVFQLVSSAKLKVHRFRESDSVDVNGARTAANLGSQVDLSATTDSSSVKEDREMQHAFSCKGLSRDEDLEVPSVKQNVEMHRASSPAEVSQDQAHKVVSEDDYGAVQAAKDVENNDPNFDAGNNEHRQCSPSVDFVGIGTFDDFVIAIDNLLKNYYDLPQHIKWSYYQLCSSQNALLHIGLLKDINPVLVAGCIIETVGIAHAMKSCELSTFLRDCAIWDEKLSVLKAWGMDVAFLCAHLHRLQRIACNPEAVNDRQRYMNLCSVLTDTADKMKGLKEHLSELMSVSERRADSIEDLKTVIDKYELRFQEVANAPW